MTKEPTLHRWALLDKNGKTRGTCTAPGRWRARLEFKRMRNGRPLAEGWTIVDRGPVDESVQRAADAFHKTLAETKPRAFQVGDRVMAGPLMNPLYPWERHLEGIAGKVTKRCSASRVMVGWDNGEKSNYEDKELSPAPQPKDEDEDPPITPLNKPTLRVPAYKAELDAARQEIATLKAEVERLTEVPPCPEDPNEAAIHRAAVKQSQETGEPFRVVLLTLERDSARHGRDSWRQAQLNALGDLDLAQAKLGDIRAIMRVNDMVSAIPEDAEPWHFHGLVQTVLDR